MTLPRPLVWTCQSAPVTGFLHTPEGTPSRGVILVAGGTQTRVGAHKMLTNLAEALAANGMAALRFDIRGRGDSGGDYPGYETLDDDLAAARKTFQQEMPSLSHFTLLGHCDGAAAVAFAAGRGLSCDSLVLLNPWARTAETQALAGQASNRQALFDTARWKRLFTGKLNIINSIKSLFQSLSAPDGASVPTDGLLAQWHRSWAALRLPVLVVTGANDASGKEFLALLSSLPRHAKLSLTTVPDGDHSLSSPAQTQLLHNSISSWLATH